MLNFISILLISLAIFGLQLAYRNKEANNIKKAITFVWLTWLFGVFFLILCYIFVKHWFAKEYLTRVFYQLKIVEIGSWWFWIILFIAITITCAWMPHPKRNFMLVCISIPLLWMSIFCLELALVSNYTLKLLDSDMNIRQDAILNLRNHFDSIIAKSLLDPVKIKAKLAIPALVRSLENDPNPYVRLESAMCLGIIGEEVAIPYLKKALNDSHENVRKHAAEALKKIHP